MHSSERPAADFETLPAAIREAVLELAPLTASKEPVVLTWNDRYVVVPIVVTVDLPSRGTGGIDIRRKEPLVVVLDLVHYPRRAPFVFCDRKDFPGDELPHVIPTTPGQPTWLCLHRGNIDHWFVDRTLLQLVERARSWLADAAAGLLIRGDDAFEPTRIQAGSQIWVGDVGEIDKHVREGWASSGGAPGFAFLFTWLSFEPRILTGWSGSLAIDVQFALDEAQDESLSKFRDFARGYNDARRDSEKSPCMLFGIMVWPGSAPVSRYFSRLPDTFETLDAFCAQLGAPLGDALAALEAKDLSILGGMVPLIVAVPRPTRLIGRTSSIEHLGFLCFREGDEPPPEKDVFVFGHRNALTSEFARSLSATKGDPSLLAKPLLLGVGAIGSKVSLHLGKSGFRDQILVDTGTIAPHHVVRHGLPGGHLGKNKAEAVATVVKDLFAGCRETPDVKHLDRDALDILPDAQLLADRSILVDGTASPVVLEALITADTPPMLPVVRIEIADQGRLGLFSAEGPDRNPRLDDIRAFLFDLGRTDDRIAGWLRRHRDEIEAVRGPVLEDIGIGISCDTETMRIADDLAAFHAAAFSRGLRRLAVQRGAGGRLDVVMHALEDEEPEVGVRTYSIPPIVELSVDGLPDWRIRLSQPVIAAMRASMRARGHRETGGILLGHTASKRRLMYVTAAIEQLGGGSRDHFTRDARATGPALDAADRTASMITYLGDWHTHPSSSNRPSDIDLGALSESARTLRHVGLPAVILIVGANGVRAVGLQRPVGRLGAS